MLEARHSVQAAAWTLLTQAMAMWLLVALMWQKTYTFQLQNGPAGDIFKDSEQSILRALLFITWEESKDAGSCFRTLRVQPSLLFAGVFLLGCLILLGWIQVLLDSMQSGPRQQQGLLPLTRQS